MRRTARGWAARLAFTQAEPGPYFSTSTFISVSALSPSRAVRWASTMRRWYLAAASRIGSSSMRKRLVAIARS